MEDLLIRGGQVIDGSGTPGRRADVAIRNGHITAIGDCRDLDAQREIDASGQIVAPGFIDIHSDFTLPLNPLAESKIRQGVTTEVVGNCGYSTAPVLPGKAEALRDYLAAGAPWLEYEPRTFAQYLDSFPATSVNTVMQVGHATLRLMAVGLEARNPRPSELSHMQQLLDESLEAGALGMSTGLFTAPGNYARSEELQALAGVLRRHGATYASHIRDEANHVFEAVREAISIGESAGVRVQIAHLKLSGTDNWGDVPSLLSMISEAKAWGIDLFCDQYPYTAGTNPLRNLLPVWVQEGGMEVMLQRLRDGEARERVRGEILQNGLNNFGRVESWHAVRIAISPEMPELAGQTVGQVAQARGIDQLDAACDILLTDQGHTRIVVASMAEEDVQEILRSPMVLVGSDATPWRPTESPARGSRTPVSTAPLSESSAITSVTWACCPCTPPSTR